MAELVPFDAKLKIALEGKKRLRTLDPISFKVFGTLWKIGRGFSTDLASLPWFARFLTHWTTLALAGLWHDARYDAKDVSRKIADQGFYDIAISGEIRTKVWKAKLMYVFLRLFGWWRWNRVSDKILSVFKK